MEPWYENWDPLPARLSYDWKYKLDKKYPWWPLIVVDGGIVLTLLIFGIMAYFTPPNVSRLDTLGIFVLAILSVVAMGLVAMMAGPFLVGFPVWLFMLHVKFWRDNVPTKKNQARWVLDAMQKGGDK